jgi:hypothetical protein
MRCERGFTVIEAMVASFVLVSGLLTGLGVFGHSRDQGATAERNQIALHQAEAALEEIRGIPYAHIALDNDLAPADPTGRISADNASFQVRPGLIEEVAYATPAEGWVSSMSTDVAIGPDGHPVDLEIHRYVTWRDEECRVADLEGTGLPGLPDAINTVQVPLELNLNGLISSKIATLDPRSTTRGLLSSLEPRLRAFRDQLAVHESPLGAIAAVSELDLCDISLTALDHLQRIGTLTPSLSSTPAGDLTDRLLTLEALLKQCSSAGCPAGTDDTIRGIGTELSCVFGASVDTATEFNSYFATIESALGGLPTDASDTNRNTKRVTVAVIVEPRSGVGPFEPVWATTVIRDPAAGVLGTNAPTVC